MAKPLVFQFGNTDLSFTLQKWIAANYAVTRRLKSWTNRNTVANWRLLPTMAVPS